MARPNMVAARPLRIIEKGVCLRRDYLPTVIVETTSVSIVCRLGPVVHGTSPYVLTIPVLHAAIATCFSLRRLYVSQAVKHKIPITVD